MSNHSLNSQLASSTRTCIKRIRNIIVDFSRTAVQYSATFLVGRKCKNRSTARHLTAGNDTPLAARFDRVPTKPETQTPQPQAQESAEQDRRAWTSDMPLFEAVSFISMLQPCAGCMRSDEFFFCVSQIPGAIEFGRGSQPSP